MKACAMNYIISQGMILRISLKGLGRLYWSEEYTTMMDIIFDILPIFPFTTSEMQCDYY